jgi:hypothetical protein
MRKLKIVEHISLDGVIQISGEDGDFPDGDWTAPYRIPRWPGLRYGHPSFWFLSPERLRRFVNPVRAPYWTGFNFAAVPASSSWHTL